MCVFIHHSFQGAYAACLPACLLASCLLFTCAFLPAAAAAAGAGASYCAGFSCCCCCCSYQCKHCNHQMTDGPRANRSIVTSVCMTFTITGRVSIGRCGRGRSETERERKDVKM